jgi:hypothetical protein
LSQKNLLGTKKPFPGVIILLKGDKVPYGTPAGKGKTDGTES